MHKREERQEKHQQWAKTHREQINAHERQRYAEDPTKLLERNQRRRAQRAAAPRNDLTAAEWREICAAHDYRCVYCNRKMQRLAQDHITPLSKGGNHSVDNVVPACRSCNSKKKDGKPLCPVQPLLLTIAKSRKTE